MILFALVAALFAAGSLGGGFVDNWSVEPAHAVAWGSLVDPDGAFDGGNGTPGLPGCNRYTNQMVAYNSLNGRYYRCWYWPNIGWGDWLLI